MSGQRSSSSEEDNPAFFNSIDRLKESFLYATAQGGNAQDCESLLSIGADVNWKGQDGATPLLAACKRGHREAVAVLLAYGADGNAAGDDNLTALHLASRRGDLNMVNLLLDSSVDVTLKTRDGNTAFEIAKTKGHDDICQRLVQHRHNPRSSPSSSSSSSSSIRASGSTTTTSGNGSKFSNRGANITPKDKDHEDHKSSPGRSSNERGNRSSLTIEGAVKLSEEESYRSSVRPSSKVQDKREAASSLDISSTVRNTMPGIAAPKTESSRSYSVSVNNSGSRAEDTDLSSVADLKKLLHKANANLLTMESDKNRKEGEYEVLRMQFEEVIIECAVAGKESLALKEELLSMKELVLECNEEISLLRGESEAVQELATVEDCEKVEKVLKNSLQNLEDHKAALIRDMLAGSERPAEEQRMCVVCQAHEKSVVLLPCRHACVCKNCSNNPQLINCPLCREKIEDRISVYM